MGHQGGVGALIRRWAQYLLQFHCAAHKFMLACVGAFDTEECYEIDRLLSAVYNEFKQSSKKRERLAAIFDELKARATIDIKADVATITT